MVGWDARNGDCATIPRTAMIQARVRVSGPAREHTTEEENGV